MSRAKRLLHFKNALTARSHQQLKQAGVHFSSCLSLLCAALLSLGSLCHFHTFSCHLFKLQVEKKNHEYFVSKLGSIVFKMCFYNVVKSVHFFFSTRKLEKKTKNEKFTV